MTRSAIALLFALVTTMGCQTMGTEQQGPSPTAMETAITDAQKLMKAQKYSDALSRLENALQQERNSDLAPVAKYMIAMVYVAADNPQRDYAQALTEFDEFIDFYPDHERAAEAKSWRQALKTILDTRKENERLHKNIEGLKQLDMRQEEKRMGK